jgi:hypothetical protein
MKRPPEVMLLIRYKCGCIPPPHHDYIERGALNISIAAALKARYLNVPVICRSCADFDRSEDPRVMYLERTAVENEMTEEAVDEEKELMVGMERMVLADVGNKGEEKGTKEDENDEEKKRRDAIKAWAKDFVRRSRLAWGRPLGSAARRRHLTNA